jgi:hypothetical protein
VGGRDRLALAAEYLAVPGDEESAARTIRWMADAFEQGFRGSTESAIPWHDWLANPSGDLRRAAAIERLRHAAILDLPGAEFGW